MAKVKKAKLPTRAQYVGAKMANFLYNLKSNQALSKEDRERAALLQNQWDVLATFRLDNSQPFGWTTPSSALSLKRLCRQEN